MVLTFTPAQTLQSERIAYPGMLPREILIFKAWLKLYEGQYTSYDYNVRVGSGVDPGPAYSDSVRQSSILNSQKRIDVVAWQGMQATIIEVKFMAGPAAVGQLVVYEPLFNQLHPDLPRSKMVLVTNAVQPDLTPSLKMLGITLYEIRTDFSSLTAPPVGSPVPPGWSAGSFVL